VIKFFRKIRQRLLSENKMSKYLIYALGEIILVVIGILIALSINNWNERNKRRSQEIQLLSLMKTELEQNLKTVDRANMYNLKIRESIEILLDHIEGNKPYHDSLNFHFALMTISFNDEIPSTSFETLKAKGIDLISNEELRQNIVNYHHWNNKRSARDSERYYDLLDHAQKNLFNTRFEATWDYANFESANMVPINYESLKNDQDFIYFLKTLRGNNYWHVTRHMDNFKYHGNNLINMISEEIP